MRFIDFLKKSDLDLNKYIFYYLLQYLNLRFLKKYKKFNNISLFYKIRKNISLIKTTLNFN